jgi:hypothetical protein
VEQLSCIDESVTSAAQHCISRGETGGDTGELEAEGGREDEEERHIIAMALVSMRKCPGRTDGGAEARLRK